MTRTFAIVVGINRYPKFTGQNPLKGAVRDACDFAEWALDDAGGKVAPGDLYFWTHPWAQPEEGANPIADELPDLGDLPNLSDYLSGEIPQWFHEFDDLASPDRTRPPAAREIIYTIQMAGRAAFRSRTFEAGPQSRVLVFLAGHGVRATPSGSLNGETCFVAADFRPTGNDLAAGLVPCESLRTALLNDRFNEAHLFLDCCRVTTSKLDMKAVQLADNSKDSYALPWTLAFAAGVMQPAYETDADPKRGAFTITLMDGLRTCREGPVHELTAERLRGFVLDNIATHTGRGQKPHVTFQPDPVGPVVVAGAVAAPPAPPAPPQPEPLVPGPVADLSALAPGTPMVLKDGSGQVVQVDDPIVAGAAPIQLPPLKVGLYVLEVAADAKRYALFRQPGTETIHVE